MKHVQHICHQQKALGDKLGAFSHRIAVPPTKPAHTLTCTRWNSGRKLNIKVLVTNASEAC